MARALLNVKSVQAARPADKEYLVSDGDGLFLRVLPTGKKTWQFIYTQGKRRRKLSIGDTSDVSLAAARERAAEEREHVVAGNDPRVAHLAREAAQARELAQLRAETESKNAENLTMQAMLDTWLADGVSRSDGNAALRASFGKYITPRLGQKRVRETTEVDIRDALRAVGRLQGKNRTAVLLLADIRQMFRWAEKRRPWRQLLVEGNPAELVDAKQVVQANYDLANERDRVLSVEEIRALRDALSRIQAAYDTSADKRVAVRPLNTETQLAVWIMLSTCCRVGELSCARWENVNLTTGEWLVLRENTKTKKADPHIFYQSSRKSPFFLYIVSAVMEPRCTAMEPRRSHDAPRWSRVTLPSAGMCRYPERSLK